MRNLDREPGFWLTVAVLVPFIAVVHLASIVRDLRVRCRR